MMMMVLLLLLLLLLIIIIIIIIIIILADQLECEVILKCLVTLTVAVVLLQRILKASV